jgi:hypothetical protein
MNRAADRIVLEAGLDLSTAASADLEQSLYRAPLPLPQGVAHNWKQLFAIPDP